MQMVGFGGDWETGDNRGENVTLVMGLILELGMPEITMINSINHYV